MTISIHKSSVGVFTHFLGNLSDLLEKAAEHAKARDIDPAILLRTRLYPNMYNLIRQVGETNRHAVVACALLAGVKPPVFPDSEPDVAELRRGSRQRSNSCRRCHLARSTLPETSKWSSRSETARRGNSRANRYCLRSASRSSFFTSPPLTISCVIAASSSPKKIFWAPPINSWKQPDFPKDQIS